MNRRQQHRRIVEILGTIVLVVGCTPTASGLRSDPLPARDLTTQSIRPADHAARRYAKIIASRVAAAARHSKPAERRPNLVRDRTVVKIAADGRPMVEQLGEASWYGSWHHGRATASGALFDQYALTAAHPTLPLGTKVTVINLATGASVDVVVNDRGPYAYGRDIDLSRAAAQAIGLIRPGTAAVRIQAVVGAGLVRPARG